MLTKGQAAESRNAMVTAKGLAERAAELEDSARAEELHAVALDDARGEQVVGMVRAMFDAVDLQVPAEVAQAVLRGEDVSSEVAAAAREQVRRVIAAEARPEILAELEAEHLARPALPAGESAPVDEVVDGEVVGDGDTAWDTNGGGIGPMVIRRVGGSLNQI
jgi:hypothetical protein